MGATPQGARDEREAAAWVRGKVHFVLPVRIGEVTVVSGIDEKLVLESIRSALS